MALSTSLQQIIKAGQGYGTPPPSAVSRLERYGNDIFNEFDQGGAGDAERAYINSGAVRTLDDVTRLGTNASNLVSRSYKTSRGTLERQRRALGQTVGGHDEASINRRFGMAQALSDVDARNRAYASDQERRNVVRASAGGLRDIIDQAAVGGLSTAAQMETNRQVEYTQAKAEYDAKKKQALGTLASIGLSFVPGGVFLAPAVSGAIAKS